MLKTLCERFVLSFFYYAVMGQASGDETVECWGFNNTGQCNVPNGVGEGGNLITKVAAGKSHTGAILN